MSRRTPQPLFPKDGSRDPLLAAAFSVVSSGAPLTVSAVAAEAGVSRGTVYRRFADRDALMAALVATGLLPEVPHAAPDARERILDAVGGLLGRQGLSTTTLEDVAREAKVGPVTVYRHFGDRMGLFRAFVAERTPRRLVTSVETSGDPVADLTALTRESLAFARDYRGLFLLMLSPDPEAAALLATLRKGTTSVREMMTRAAHAVAPDPTGRTVAAYMGILVAIAWMGPKDVDEDARFVVSTFLHGVAR